MMVAAGTKLIHYTSKGATQHSIMQLGYLRVMP